MATTETTALEETLDCTNEEELQEANAADIASTGTTAVNAAPTTHVAAATATTAPVKKLLTPPTPVTSPIPVQDTESSLIEKVIARYFDADRTYILDLLDPAIAKIMRDNIIGTINLAVSLENANRPKGESLAKRKTLPQSVAVAAILATEEVKFLRQQGGSGGQVAIKRYENGKFSGIYELVNPKTASNMLRTMIYNLMGRDTRRSTVEDVVAAITAELTNPNNEDKYVVRDGWPTTLIPCFNGVYNGKTHIFTPYDAPDYEEKYGDICFTYKLDTNYVENAPKPAFFDPEKHIESLFDDTPKGKASINIVWQMIQFAFRRWNGGDGHTVFLNNVSDRAAGKNGKSTVMEMITFVIQHDALDAYRKRGNARSYFSNGPKVLMVPIDKWGDQFAIGYGIRSAVMLYSDEAEGTNYIDKTGALKRIARRGINHYDIKHMDPFDYAFSGVSAHCQNEYTQMGTKDDATFNRNIYLLFEQDFSGRGDPNIRNKYIVCEETAEYILSRVCRMDFPDDYSKDDLDILKENMDAAMYENIPVYRFLDEIFEKITMPIHTTRILYTLYEEWCGPAGENIKPLPFKKFQMDVAAYCKRHNDRFDYAVRTFTYTKALLKIAAHIEQPGLIEYGKNSEYAAKTFIAGVGQYPSGHFNVDVLRGRQFKQIIIDKAHPIQNPHD